MYYHFGLAPKGRRGRESNPQGVGIPRHRFSDDSDTGTVYPYIELLIIEYIPGITTSINAENSASFAAE